MSLYKSRGDTEGKKHSNQPPLPLKQASSRPLRKMKQHKVKKLSRQSNRQCFLSRITICSEQGDLQGMERSEWVRVGYVEYRLCSVICSICLDDYVCPQMLFCGHIFCWPCLHKHQFKSLKALNCPVCDQILAFDDLKTCRITLQPQLEMSPVFLLKVKKNDSNIVYDAKSGLEDVTVSHSLRVTTASILAVYQQQLNQLEKYFASATQQEIKEIQQLKIQCLQKIREKQLTSKSVSPKKQSKNNVNLLKRLPENQKNLQYFYQEETGRLVFLHQSCERYIKSSNQALPYKLQSQIIQQQEVQCGYYKHLKHLHPNLQIIVVFIDLSGLIDKNSHQQYETQIKQYKRCKANAEQRQSKDAQRRSKIFQEERQYMRELQRMEEKKIFDIRVPTMINPGEIESHTYFPPLIDTSKQEKEKEKEQQQQELKKLQSIQRIESEQTKSTFNEEDFPQINQRNKSQKIKNLNKKKKNKKQFAVDATALFFNNNLEQ